MSNWSSSTIRTKICNNFASVSPSVRVTFSPFPFRIPCAFCAFNTRFMHTFFSLWIFPRMKKKRGFNDYCINCDMPAIWCWVEQFNFFHWIEIASRHRHRGKFTLAVACVASTWVYKHCSGIKQPILRLFREFNKIPRWKLLCAVDLFGMYSFQRHNHDKTRNNNNKRKSVWFSSCEIGLSGLFNQLCHGANGNGTWNYLTVTIFIFRAFVSMFVHSLRYK